MQIDRGKWNCGRRYSYSQLLSRNHNKMCCLGFYAKFLGAEDISIIGIPFPTLCKSKIAWPLKMFEIANTIDCFPDLWEDVFVKINDSETIDNETRESWIAAGFKIIFGVDVEFIGEYPNV